MAEWYQLSVAEVLAKVDTDARQGLSQAEVSRRLEKYGRNELVERSLKSPWAILWEQLTATLVVVLIVAALLSALLGDYKDAIAILAIVILNAALGVRQEYQAEQAMAALKKLAVPIVRVRRGGRVQEISSHDLTLGDIVLLEAGNLIPADGRALQSANLQVQEAALTGESAPVEKHTDAIPATDQALGDRHNMVHMGTVVTYGRGEMVVTAIGMQTELGRVAELIQSVENEATPLQRRLDQVGRNLAFVALAIVLVIFGLGLLRGEELRTMLLAAVSIAVAAVPEGLPAVVTIALALGAQRMLRRHALIRKLPAVETLGSVTVICSDKTGTLTENRMTVTALDVAGEQIDLTAERSRSQADTIAIIESAPHTARPALALLLAGGTLCNDALLEADDRESGAFHVVGDPTEGALAVAAARVGLLKDDLEELFPRVAELPFDSVRKRMTTIHQLPPITTAVPTGLTPIWTLLQTRTVPVYVSFTKGAVDSLLNISSAVWEENAAHPIGPEHRERIMAAHNRLAAKGMRILGLAMRSLDQQLDKQTAADLEQDLTFIGMTAMIDPPRAEVKAAVQTCQSAGMRTLMITGDHPLTARHIADQLGIDSDGGLLTGQELDQLSADELDGVVEKVSVYARVSPEHKLNIVEALQKRGHIVAMTGDGVNDAPALKKADIGVAMGITGTDVAKEAADMVLQDDNFVTIVAAVEEGRVIYDNIRKFIKYLLSCNSGEILVMLIGPLLGMPLPLLPLQILWMNLVTDGFPALALGVEAAERNVMQRPPYPPAESIFSRGVGRTIVWVGALMGAVSLLMGYLDWRVGDPNWQTMVFTTLTLSQLGLALAMRSERDSVFQIGFFSNRAMIGAVALTFLLQLALIYVPFLRELFELERLSMTDLAISLAAATVVFWAVEVEKWWRRR